MMVSVQVGVKGRSGEAHSLHFRRDRGEAQAWLEQSASSEPSHTLLA